MKCYQPMTIKVFNEGNSLETEQLVDRELKVFAIVNDLRYFQSEYKRGMEVIIETVPDACKLIHWFAPTQQEYDTLNSMAIGTRFTNRAIPGQYITRLA